ncbi:MAG: 3'(2'),5'-bisphosphate nucleotidase CysQ [Balneolaceae bacterium]
MKIAGDIITGGDVTGAELPVLINDKINEQAMDTTDMTETIINISRQAGKAILEYYTEDIEVEQKSDDSPLTKADTAAHHLIVGALKKFTGDIPVISEEGGISGYDERKSWKRFWLVDPLDGTKEFIKRNGEFTVNIALIENGIPVLGVVHVPAGDVTYTGGKGAGSFKIISSGEPVRLRSVKPDLADPLAVVVSRSHGSDELQEELTGQGISIGKTLIAGSSLKFCLVAEGTADIYPRMGPTMEWDTAAGDAVFRYSGENGARVSPLSYNKPLLKNEGFIIGLE